MFVYIGHVWISLKGDKYIGLSVGFRAQNNHHQWTMSGQSFGLPVILTGYINNRPEKKQIHTITFRENK